MLQEFGVVYGIPVELLSQLMVKFSVVKQTKIEGNRVGVGQSLVQRNSPLANGERA